MRRRLSRLAFRSLSVPLQVKILGAISAVAVLFGAVVHLSARASLAAELSRLTEQATRTRAEGFAARAERLLITGNRIALQDLVHREHLGLGALRYIIVYDARRRIVAHSFSGAPPPSLTASLPRSRITSSQSRTLRAGEEIIFDAVVPVLHGEAGFIQMGVGSKPIADRMDRMIRRLWLVLGGCLLVGLLLILLLSRTLSAPLHRLVRAANELRRGNLSYRVPVQAHDEVGALTAAFNRMADERQRHLMELADAHAERQELLDAIVHAQEEERCRISHDLHDEIGGSLSALLLDLRRRNEQCPSADEPDSTWSSIEQQVGALIERVRHMAWTLRPAALDDVGLCAAIEQLTEELQRHSSAHIDFCGSSASSGEDCCDSVAKIALYRVTQEALTNSLNHSGASHVSVVVTATDSGLSVVVEDDGCGFDTSADLTDRPHLGLIGMRERIAAAGGTLTIESEPGSGTLVRASVPTGPGESALPCRSAPSAGDHGASTRQASSRTKEESGSEVQHDEIQGVAGR